MTSTTIVVLCLLFLPTAAKILTRAESEIFDSAEAQQKIEKIKQKMSEIKGQAQLCEDYGHVTKKMADPTSFCDPFPHGYHKLMEHSVYRYSVKDTRKIYIEAQISSSDMGRGTDVSNRVRAEMRAFHRVCNSDHSGHVIPNELGGAGEEHNLFIQSANLNVSFWKRITNLASRHLWQEIREKLDNSGQAQRRGVSIDVAFKYSHADNPNRPSKFYYRIGLFVEDKLVEDIFGKFNNTEQVDLSLTSCSGTGVNTLYYVYGTERDVEKFVARQSCNVEEKYRSLFILPQ